MERIIGLRREDKNKWEKRVTLSPEHVKLLKEDYGIKTILQPFEARAIPRSEFEAAGAEFDEDLSRCQTIFAVKEVPLNLILPEKTYLFFSHTVKGQAYNMPLLKKMMDLKCNLIDYEMIKDDTGRRLVFFGRFAGVAGMIDTLHLLGKRLKSKGFNNPLEEIKHAYEYKDINEAKTDLKKIGESIVENGLSDEIGPIVCGFAGYGNVSKGAQEIFDILPHQIIETEDLAKSSPLLKAGLYKVVFKEIDMVEPVSPDDKFELQDYFDNPHKYKSKFERHIPHLNVIINAIYWNPNYPRFITKEFLRENQNLKLEFICDITCDINGAVEPTYKSTPSDNPCYVYDAENDSYKDGYEGKGVVIISVDNLPTELPSDASSEFSKALHKFVPGIVDATLTDKFDDVDFPPEIKRAVIVYKGKLTPKYEYLNKHLEKALLQTV